jgi:hypothetical protein
MRNYACLNASRLQINHMQLTIVGKRVPELAIRNTRNMF